MRNMTKNPCRRHLKTKHLSEVEIGRLGVEPCETLMPCWSGLPKADDDFAHGVALGGDQGGLLALADVENAIDDRLDQARVDQTRNLVQHRTRDGRLAANAALRYEPRNKTANKQNRVSNRL